MSNLLKDYIHHKNIFNIETTEIKIYKDMYVIKPYKEACKMMTDV